MVAITMQDLTKAFGKTVAVDRLTLSIPAGALFFLLGPSGCGKTTLLRMIAGFVDPTSGTLLFDQQDITHTPPNKRDTGMVFQSYALWPHMTVADNVGFGLDVRKISGSERASRIADALKLVHMAEYADRKPTQLSGGQQQRVALARALAIRPRCLLLDEPLSNLDAKLRLDMRQEIRDIVKKTGITAVYVTHDQKEALSMADGIAVMSRGKLQQSGTPEDLYRKPVNRFVADFIGESNFITGKVTELMSDDICLQTSAGVIRAKGNSQTYTVGSSAIAAIRPEAVSFGGFGPNILHTRRVGLTYLGEMAEHLLELPDGNRLKAFELNPHPGQKIGDDVTISINPEHVTVVAE